MHKVNGKCTTACSMYNEFKQKVFHLVFRKMIIHVHVTLIWNDQPVPLSYNYLFCVCKISIHCFVIELYM